MARPSLRAKRVQRVPDELGGFSDGGLAILDPEGRSVHITPSRVAGALRYFVARVELHGADGLPQRLALTAALLGEGVSYVTRSLASVIAYDTDASVVIVDMNWRRPTPRVTNPDGSTEPGVQPAEQKRGSKRSSEPVASRPGFIDAIERDVPLSDVIMPTANPRLSIIPAGEVPLARRPALAASSALASVLDQLDGQFDHLLLDLPPVLATSDAMNLSQFADASVLVVRQGATSESQVAAALEEMQGVEVLGVILNRFGTRIPKRLRRLVGT